MSRLRFKSAAESDALARQHGVQIVPDRPPCPPRFAAQQVRCADWEARVDIILLKAEVRRLLKAAKMEPLFRETPRDHL